MPKVSNKRFCGRNIKKIAGSTSTSSSNSQQITSAPPVLALVPSSPPVPPTQDQTFVIPESMTSIVNSAVEAIAKSNEFRTSIFKRMVVEVKELQLANVDTSCLNMQEQVHFSHACDQLLDIKSNIGKEIDVNVVQTVVKAAARSIIAKEGIKVSLVVPGVVAPVPTSEKMECD